MEKKYTLNYSRLSIIPKYNHKCHDECAPMIDKTLSEVW
jgi:hypothetical protein